MYSYCPNCGAAYSETSYLKGKIHCQNCDFDFYINPGPCNGLLLENETGEILLVKRKYAPDKGKWDVPGGFVDQEEDLETSTIREAKEELGVDISDVQYIASYADTYQFQGITIPTLIFLMTARISGGQLKAQDDAEEFRFFAKDQIPWEDLAFNFLRTALKDYLRDQQ